MSRMRPANENNVDIGSRVEFHRALELADAEYAESWERGRLRR